MLVDRLMGRLPTGSLRVLGDTPGAEVTVDGVPSGALDQRGELVLVEIAAGRHTVHVRDPRRDRSRDLPVMVGENATATLRVILKPALPPLTATPAAVQADDPPPAAKPSSLRRVFGWTSVGLGAGLLGAAVYSWVRLGKIDDNPDLSAYRAEWPGPSDVGGTSDVCREAQGGKLALRDPSKAALEGSARALCNEADTLEVLQYVFLGSAIAFTGVGTYLLIADAKARSERGRVSLRPSFGAGRASLRASFRF
jgi:hypothetical protein